MHLQVLPPVGWHWPSFFIQVGKSSFSGLLSFRTHRESILAKASGVPNELSSLGTGCGGGPYGLARG